MVIVHIKKLVSNISVVISDCSGNVLFFKTAGSLGYINIKKRSVDAIAGICDSALFFLSNNRIQQVSIILEGLALGMSRKLKKGILLASKTQKFYILQFFLKNKISHNGCRKKK